MQDVEGLHGMKHPVSLVLAEDGVVCPVVPLQDTEAKTPEVEKAECSKRRSSDVSAVYPKGHLGKVCREGGGVPGHQSAGAVQRT